MMKWLVSIFVLGILYIPLYPQCCSPGNPIGGNSSLGVNDPGMLRIFTAYKYGYSGTYFEGNKPVSSQFIKDGNYNYLGLTVSYGLADKLSIDLETGYFFNKTQNYVEGIIPSQLKGKGLTDVTFLVRYSFYKDLIRDIEMNVSLGFKAPLGSYQQAYQGALLTRDLQPTTGSYDLVHNLFLYKGYLPIKLRVFMLNRIEIKGKNPDQYQYGNFMATSLFGSYSLSPQWTIITQLRNEIRSRDTRPTTGTGIQTINGREKIPPSGSQKVFLIPQLSYTTLKKANFSILVDIPLYQYYNDKQLASSIAISLVYGQDI